MLQSGRGVLPFPTAYLGDVTSTAEYLTPRISCGLRPRILILEQEIGDPAQIEEPLALVDRLLDVEVCGARFIASEFAVKSLAAWPNVTVLQIAA